MLSEGMSAANAGAPDNFEEIEKAVKESRRGRWFLDEYARRRSGGDTNKLLAVIGELQHTVASNHDVIAERLCKALNLMVSVDAKLSSGSASPTPIELAPQHMKFFKQDEELFEPPAKMPGAPTAHQIAEPKPEGSKGAKLVISRQPEARSESPIASISPAAVAPQPAVEPPPKNRIVIIRHKAGDTLDVPLQDELRASA